jgi:hypothetical protein
MAIFADKVFSASSATAAFLCRGGRMTRLRSSVMTGGSTSLAMKNVH